MNDDLDFGATIRGMSPGQRVFQRYTLTRILGRGGMGVVWLARDDQLDRDIALKFLPEVVALDPQAVADLKRETRRSLELTHPNIIRIYDFLQDRRAAAISMEWVAGETLASRKLAQLAQHFEPADLTAWLIQLCAALDYAHHSAQIVHRDLKPANLMLDARGALKVADFGIAASVSDSVSRVSVRSNSSGTPVYMSPQQMMGEKPAVADDIYALGATLYELLTGRPPFHSGNIIAQVQGKVPPSIAARRAELAIAGQPIPPAWEETIAACLAKDASDRPTSAGEVADRLGLAAALPSARPTPAAIAPTPPRSKLIAPTPAPATTPIAPPGPARASLAPRNIAIAVLALAVVGAGGWWFGIHRPALAAAAEQSRIERENTAAIATARSRLAHLVTGAEAALARADWAEVERRIQAIDTEMRPAPAVVVPEWTAAETRLRELLITQREQARLAALRIPFTVVTEPAGAEVWIAGEARGITPLRDLALPLGEYPVELRLDGHVTHRADLRVAEGLPITWRQDLEIATGKIQVVGPRQNELWYSLYHERTDGSGFHDESGLGGSPTAGPESVPVGRYQIVAEYKDTVYGVPVPVLDTLLTVEEGKTTVIEVKLPAAALRIESTPAGATIASADREIGTTPLTIPFIEVGKSFTLTLSLPDHQLAERSFTLTTAGADEVWRATLEPTPKPSLREAIGQGLAAGPARLFTSAQIRVETTTRTAASAADKALQTEHQAVAQSLVGMLAGFATARATAHRPEAAPTTTAQDIQLSSRIRRLTTDPAGFWTSAEFTVEENPNLATGTRLVFNRDSSGAWRSRDVPLDPSSATKATANAPSYPGMWLTADLLPESPPAIGQRWSLPATLLNQTLPKSEMISPSGTLTGEVTALDLTDASPSIELTYRIDVRGRVPGLPAAVTATVHRRGTLTLRHLINAGYTPRATLVLEDDADVGASAPTGTFDVRALSNTKSTMIFTARPE